MNKIIDDLLFLAKENAEKDNWHNIIVIGIGKDGNNVFVDTVRDDENCVVELLGALQCANKILLNDMNKKTDEQIS